MILVWYLEDARDWMPMNNIYKTEEILKVMEKKD